MHVTLKTAEIELGKLVVLF